MIPQEPKIEKLEVDSDSDIEKALEKTRNVKDTQFPRVLRHCYTFPLSRSGLQKVKSKKQLSELLRDRFKQAYPDEQFPYKISRPALSDAMIRSKHTIKVLCKVCTNQLFYTKKFAGSMYFQLSKFSQQHVHGVPPLELPEKQQTVGQALRELPDNMGMALKMQVIKERLGTTNGEFYSAYRKIAEEYQISIKDLFLRFDCHNYAYNYLPHHLIENPLEMPDQEDIPQKATVTHLAMDLVSSQATESFISSDSQQPINQIYKRDVVNPSLPNILLVVTPQMKQLYQRYGHYIGFDLTYSLIREKPEHSKEYLLGVFAGTSESRKILVYGLLITNNQTVLAYKHIFHQFFKIMKKVPDTIITDEEFALSFALRDLKKEGIFTGQHLLDMFHILKKFNKVSSKNSSLLFRKLMHAKDRLEYRVLLNELMKQVKNDEQAELVRQFDYHSERYCYSQIDTSFVGIGISDSMNEKFHDIIKGTIPYENKYIKIVLRTLEIIHHRNQEGCLARIEYMPYDQFLNIPFIRPLRALVSNKIVQCLIKEYSNCLSYSVFSGNSQRVNLGLLANEKEYFVRTKNGSFKVIWDDITHKWVCICSFEQKSGYLCSHIMKILVDSKQTIQNYVHPRWIVTSRQICPEQLNFILEQRKYHVVSTVRLRRRRIKNTQDKPNTNDLNSI